MGRESAGNAARERIIETSLEATVEPDAALAEEAPGPNEVEAKTLEVGGVKVTQVTDRMGKVWAVPADDENVDLREFNNILAIPNTDPNFHYQYVDGGRLNEFLTAGYGLVDRAEVGIPTIHDASGNPLIHGTATHHQVGNLHLIKIPKVIAARREKIKKMRADEATASVYQPRQMGKSTGLPDIEVREHQTQTIYAKEAEVTSAKEFKTFEEG